MVNLYASLKCYDRNCLMLLVAYYTHIMMINGHLYAFYCAVNKNCEQAKQFDRIRRGSL